MILGYTIIASDNNSFMLDDLNLDKCYKFKNVYEINKIDLKFKLIKRKFNLSSTYDGFDIVSEKFKFFCENEKYRDIEFIKLPSEPAYYWFKVNNILEYDTIARSTQFLNFSIDCNGYEEIIGATPVCLKIKQELDDCFYRTDISFGSFNAKSPLIMVGKKTMDKLREAGFNDLYFEEILDKYKWQNQEV